MPEQDDNKSNFERHVQTFFTGMLMLLVGWMGATLLASVENDATIKQQLIALQTSLDELKTEFKTLNVGAINVRLQFLENRIDTLEAEK